MAVKKETKVEETKKKETTKKTPAKRTTTRAPKELKGKKVFGDVGRYFKQQGKKVWNKAKKPVAVTAAVLGVAGACIVSHEMRKTNEDLVADPEDIVDIDEQDYNVVDNDETTEEETENTEETTE